MGKNFTTQSPVAEANAARLQSEIDRLKGRLHLFSVNYGEFWKHVSEINQLFKNLKPLPSEDRQRLWAEFESTCQTAKRQQEDTRLKLKNVSQQKRGLVDSKLNEAYYQAKGSHSASDLAKAKGLLKEALGWMKDGWTGFNVTTQLFTLNEGRMLKEDHDACWKKWKEVNDTIGCRRQELGDLNFSHFKSEAYDALSAADHDPRGAKEKVKSIQGEMRGNVMSRVQFDEIRRILDQAWQRATGRQEARQREWREQMQEIISRKKALMDKDEDVIARLESQIDHCRDLERDARSDDFARTVRGWIEEKYDKISDIQRSIRELEEQIRSIQAKLG